MAKKVKRSMGRYRLPVFIVGVLLVIGALAVLIIGLINFTGDQDVSDDQTNPVYVDTSEDALDSGTTDESEESQMHIALSDGQAEPQASEYTPLANGEPLSEEEIERIMARLPELVMESEDQEDFKLPEESLPPPRTGETLPEMFPLPENVEPVKVDSGPLEVLRFAPEGEIPLAPFVNVTFNQPMVPLTSLGDLAAEDVPVLIEPTLPGTWRWLGTKTLTFEYDSAEIDRLPMATEYRVTVPAGTESAVGRELAEAVDWTFSTPPPKMISQYPYDEPQPLDPSFFVAFDQRINPAAVLETIKVTAGGQPVGLRLATEEEVKADEQVSRLVETTGEGRWLAFRAVEPLPADTGIAVDVGPGTPSAEGPLVTKDVQRYHFHTYAPLRIVDHGCSWYDPCRPLSPLYIRFNNPIKTEAYNDSMLSIEPSIPGATVNIIWDTIHIKGATEGNTTYHVTVDGDIGDVFGQKMGADERLSFRIGPAEPLLTGPESILVTLDPAAKEPVFSVYTINYNKLDVKIYAVEPSDWTDFKEYLREYRRTDNPRKPPGRLLKEETLRVEAASDTLTEVGIELSEVMDGDFGQYIVIVEPPRSLFGGDDDRYWQTVHAWVQVTQIGLDAFVDHSEMIAWTTALKDGTPLAGVTIEGGSAGLGAVTGEDGIARFNLPQDGAVYLVARRGEDMAMLPSSTYYWGDDAWYPRPVKDEIRWYVFDDRQMYRPGEEVHVKGWMRRVGGKQDGDVGLLGNVVTGVNYQVIGPQGNELGNGRSEVNALGGFDFAFSLPDNANLGYAQIILNVEGGSGLNGDGYHHSFQIQEFRRPEFEVKARNETAGPYFSGEHAIVAVEANYYAGGPLPNAEVSWYVTSSRGHYEPPNWPDFNFGIWQPWWWYYEPAYEAETFGPYGEYQNETYSGVTDAAGEHYLRLDFDEGGELQPVSVLAEATVFDVNRQAWAGMTSLLVHPAELYVGMRSDHTFVERGTPLDIDLIVTDLDGAPITDRPIIVSAARLEWKYDKGNWQEIEVDIQECTVGSQLEPVTCTFQTELGGKYQITALVTDDKGRQNKCQITRWVSGGQQPPSRKVEQEQVTLIPDKEIYQPGDVAKVLVQVPFSPAESLLTISRSGILYTERFRIDEGTITLEIPIEELHIPNLRVQVDVVGAASRLDDQGELVGDVPPRPAYASGTINLNIPPLGRTLTLQATPRHKEVEPGGETIIDTLLTDATGKPVPGAELAVVVVDEAILALSNYQLADPVAVFYRHRPADLSSHYARSSIVLLDPLALRDETRGEGDLAAQALGTAVMEKEEGMLAMEAPAAAPAEDMAEAQPQPIRIRMDFNPLATFAPDVRTDANGRAQVAVQLPDNLTRYRVMVVAVDDGKRFGSVEANLTARLPLMVRPSAPRFLNFGDSFELPVVVQNQTAEPLTADVVVRGSNIEFTAETGLRVTIPGNDRLEVRFPASTIMAGTARVQIAAVAGDFADAATIDLPVYTPATTEAFATYGVVDNGSVVQPVASPSGVFPQYGGLEISTSSTALQALTDAVLYLVSYPFDCTEQIASRILAVAALRDVLTAFSAEGLPSPREMEEAVERDIEMLQLLQNDDGGFPYWRRGHDSIPYHTIHVAHALQRAKLKGFEVPVDMQQFVLEYLRYIEDHYPSWYSLRLRRTLSAYALYVRDMMGDRDVEKARRLLAEAELEEFSLEAIGWLWMVLS
ncbi:MAG: alpha-2-macroglobulin family protein, partial [Anaerolineales bacterium]